MATMKLTYVRRDGEVEKEKTWTLDWVRGAVLEMVSLDLTAMSRGLLLGHDGEPINELRISV